MPRHITTCCLCEASCGILVDADAERVTGIRGDPDDPFSRGHICPKAVALGDLHHDPDRLRRPLLKEGDAYRELPWDEALDLAGERLTAIRRAHGGDALAFYVGNPTLHNFSAMMFTPLFAQSLGTRNRFTGASVDQLPQMLAAYALFGHQLLMPVPDIDRTDYMLMFGANPAASNGSLMTAPGVTDRLDAILARGGKVILLDPRRTESARHASEHVFVRPGTDALVMLGLLHVLFAEGRVRLGRLAPSIDQLGVLEGIARRYPPERVAARTGVAPECMRRLARELAEARRAVVYGRLGISTQAFGTLAAWLAYVLNIVTGRLDEPGGAMFTTPAVDGLRLGPALGAGHYARHRSRVRGLPEFADDLPVATLVDEIETPGKGQVRALVTLAGNPVLSTPDGRRLERALGKLDFYVAIDFYRNASTQHAHLILPPASPLERGHYDLALYHYSVRNFAKYSPPVFPRPPDARHDWEILAGLIERLAGPRVPQRLAARTLAALGPERVLDLGLQTGPRGRWPFGRRGAQRLSLAALAEAPHGLDLGPLEPTLPGRLQTKGKRIGLVPAFIAADLPRLERDLATAADGLELIGRRLLRTNNSWLHNSQRLLKGPNRCTVLMHPDDAARRGLAAGAEVLVTSRTGEARLPLEVSDAIMPGVVSIPHGYGHAGLKGLRVASAHAGVSANDLTDALRIDEVSGDAAFSGTPVAVRAALSREERAALAHDKP